MAIIQLFIVNYRKLKGLPIFNDLAIPEIDPTILELEDGFPLKNKSISLHFKPLVKKVLEVTITKGGRTGVCFATFS